MKTYSGFANVRSANYIESNLPGNSRILATLKKFPTFMGCTDLPMKDDYFADMHFVVEGSQIKIYPELDSEFIYPTNHNEPVGKLWMTHHENFSKFIYNYANSRYIYDIGGAHGLLQVLMPEKESFDWTIHDINPIPDARFAGHIVQGKFTLDSYSPPTPRQSTIVHSHTLEHVLDQDKFLSDISYVQEPGDRMIFSYPNMDKMLLNNDLNFMNFEHTTYLPLEYVKYLLARNQYKILKVEYFEEHSVFIAAEKNPSPISEFAEYQISKEIIMFEKYFNTLEEKVANLNALLRRSKKPNFIFGGHIFTQFLIAAGLESKNLKYCLDNAKHKQNKRLSGTNLIVKSPEEAISSDCLIVGCVAGYGTEIKEQLMSRSEFEMEIEFL